MSTYSLGLGTNLSFLACCQDIPFIPVMQLPAIQVILENVALESKVHLLDLEIRSGTSYSVFNPVTKFTYSYLCSHSYTGLMEVLAECEECHIELLTITAVGVTSKQKIEETGRRLARTSDCGRHGRCQGPVV
ncbi:hypothetical protein ACFX1Q_031367 [Malus domestica]